MKPAVYLCRLYRAAQYSQARLRALLSGGRSKFSSRLSAGLRIAPLAGQWALIAPWPRDQRRFYCGASLGTEEWGVSEWHGYGHHDSSGQSLSVSAQCRWDTCDTRGYITQCLPQGRSILSGPLPFIGKCRAMVAMITLWYV